MSKKKAIQDYNEAFVKIVDQLQTLTNFQLNPSHENEDPNKTFTSIYINYGSSSDIITFGASHFIKLQEGYKTEPFFFVSAPYGTIKSGGFLILYYLYKFKEDHNDLVKNIINAYMKMLHP